MAIGMAGSTAAKVLADRGLRVLLAEKAGESGAQVRDCTTVVACEEKEGFVEVTLQEKETFVEKAAYVLDCEGVVGCGGGQAQAAKGNIGIYNHLPDLQ